MSEIGAIIIAANPAAFREEPELVEHADIEFHRRHCENVGAVYWHLPGREKHHPWIEDVKSGYFSEPVRRVAYTFDVEEIKTMEELVRDFEEEKKYIPGTRLKYFDEWKETDYEKHWLWIKIKNIRPLLEERPLGSFRRAIGIKAGEPVKINRNYVVVFP